MYNRSNNSSSISEFIKDNKINEDDESQSQNTYTNKAASENVFKFDLGASSSQKSKLDEDFMFDMDKGKLMNSSRISMSSFCFRN